MLFINDPDSYRAIIDERRRSDGQAIADTPVVETPTRATRPTLRRDPYGYRAQPAPIV